MESDEEEFDQSSLHSRRNPTANRGLTIDFYSSTRLPNSELYDNSNSQRERKNLNNERLG